MALTTNREAYLSNRFLTEQDLHQKFAWPDFNLEASKWQERTAHFLTGRLYSRETFVSPDGSGVVDDLGHRAVAKRNLALPCEGTPPDWREILDPSLVRSAVLLQAYRDAGVSEETLRFAGQEGELKKRTDPSPYGPCLHHLWGEAQRHCGSDIKACFQQLAEWAFHRPKCWDRDDSHRLDGTRPPASERFQISWYRAAVTWIDPRLEPYFNRAASWQDTDDLNRPWRTTRDGHEWSVRINDFPDEYMYSLLVNGELIGDFLRWPSEWERPGDPPKPKQKNPKIKPVDLLPRYLDGQHKEVWDELVRLGPQVRSADLYECSRAVAREVMRRAHYNLSLLLPRLKELGYEFLEGEGSGMGPWAPPYPGPWVPPSADDIEPRFEKVLPLSLGAWLESIGYVSLTGSHPKLSPLPIASERPKVYPDPFEVRLFPELLTPSIESWVSTGREGTFDFAISESSVSKAMVKTAEYGIMGDYRVEFPCQAADVRMLGLKGRPYFVDYLRLAFKWGGFPGWAEEKSPPHEEIRFLAEGLLEL